MVTTKTYAEKKWVGTYKVRSTHQLVYNPDNSVEYIEKEDEMNVVIAYDENISRYRIYGLCKTHPELDIIAHISEDGEIYLVGSSFSDKKKWVFVMQDNGGSQSSYQYYTKPLFSLPYVFTMDDSGQITHIPTPNVIAVSVFEVDSDKSEIRHLDSSEKHVYPAGQLHFERKSKSVTIPQSSTSGHRKSMHTTGESQSVDQTLKMVY